MMCDVGSPKQKHHEIKRACCDSAYSNGTYLGFVLIRLYGSTGNVEMYTSLDNGSEKTWLLSDVAKKVGISGTVTRLKMASIIVAA